MLQQLIQVQKQKTVKETRKFSDILRTTKLKQHFGYYVDRCDTTRQTFCAVGALAHEIAGWSGNTDFGKTKFGRNFDRGIHDTIVAMNDVQHKSFSEIADYLESRGL